MGTRDVSQCFECGVVGEGEVDIDNELFLNLTINTPRSCGSSGHPTRVFVSLNRPPPCHSKALPWRPPPRVPCAHPSVPLTPSPSHQCALTARFTIARFLAHSPSPPHQCARTAHFTLRAFLRAHPSVFSHFLIGPILAVCRILLFSDVLVEVFFTPLHSAATFGVRTCIPTSNSNELGLKVMRLPRGNLATLVTWADSRR